jgi:hypothetical protein
MTERKIHNHKSEIHIDYTIEQYGYHPDKLGRTSTKFVIANCRFCGQAMPVRKGFFNKAGSACHKECRMQEQSLCGSPFSNKKVRDKSKETNLRRYGFEYASQNAEIGNRISRAKRITDAILAELLSLGLPTTIKKQVDCTKVDFVGRNFQFILNNNAECCEPHGKRQFQLKKSQAFPGRCFQMFEHQWNDRRSQILNFIKTIVGMNTHKVAARKCQVTYDECREFFNDNHIQGYGIRTLKFFNLVYTGEVVASMTISKHHRQGQDSKNIVLNRLCFKEGVNVQGGSSKLFKRLVDWAREERYNKVVSWSDNCWTEGEIYRTLGFELTKEYGPDYFYWDLTKHKYHSKQSQQKKKTGCPEGMTEREWCIERGLSRIWDCGKRLWEYEI